MTHSEFNHLLGSIKALSPAQLRQLRQQLDSELSHAASPPVADATAPRREEPDSQELQRRLLAAGVISELRPPITDLAPYQDRRAVPIQGEPISETALRERR